jgi:UDP-N-acetylglucosamine 2-epimerase
VTKREYILVTVHRPGNVDEPQRLRSIVETFVEASEEVKLVIPAHPRMMNRLRALGLLSLLRQCRSLVLTKPIGYLESIALLDTAAGVLTDSGGLQKEAFLLGVPCATLRNSTEWTETIEAGANTLVDVDKTRILEAVLKAMKSQGPRSKPIYSKNPFGDGKAAGRIVHILMRTYAAA